MFTLGVSPALIGEDGGVSMVSVSTVAGVTSTSEETIRLSLTGDGDEGGRLPGRVGDAGVAGRGHVGDDEGDGVGRQRGGRLGDGGGGGDPRRDGGGHGADDHAGRVDAADGDAGADAAVDRRERRREHGDGESEPCVERSGGGDGVRRGGVADGRRGLLAEPEEGC